MSRRKHTPKNARAVPPFEGDGKGHKDKRREVVLGFPYVGKKNMRERKGAGKGVGNSIIRKAPYRGE